MTSHLYLMRHGQTLFNALERIQGWSDSPLTELGIEQAQMAADYFKAQGLTFDSYYSSTSERASDTLEIATGVTSYTRLKGLKEMNFGNFEGQQEYLHPPRQVRRAVGNYYVVHGGESDEEVARRVHTTITHILEENDGKTILAVSHAGAIMHFLNSIGVDVESMGFFPSNCCIFDLSFEKGAFTLHGMIDPVKGEIFEYLGDLT